MAYPELRLLGRWTNTNTNGTGSGKAANTQWNPPAVQTTDPSLPQGMLNGQQVGEAAFLVVYSPYSQKNGIGDLQYAQLILDGTPYEYVFVSGRQDTSMAPPKNRVRRGTIIKLGDPTFGRNGKQARLLDATCPKFISNVSVRGWAGATAINDNYTIEVWGYTYGAQQLAGLMTNFSSGSVGIADPANSRTFVVPGRTVEALGDWRRNWKALPGGSAQGSGASQIHKMVRRARNNQATTANTAYAFQFQNSTDNPGVEYAQDNLYFPLNAESAILAERLGVKSPFPTSTGAELQSAAIYTPGQAEKRHPQGGMPAGFYRNELNFGLATDQTNEFEGVPELPQGPQLLTNETAYVGAVDNGTSVAASAVMVAFVGTFIAGGAQEVI